MAPHQRGFLVGHWLFNGAWLAALSFVYDPISHVKIRATTVVMFVVLTRLLEFVVSLVYTVISSYPTLERSCELALH